ncbi:MAG: O-antigen ligase family protein, partial [Acidimicrobiales bacterium]
AGRRAGRWCGRRRQRKHVIATAVPRAGDSGRLGAAPGLRPTPGTGQVPAGHDGKLFAVLMGGYPLAWALGLAPVFYMMLAVPMAMWLLRNRPFQIPRGTVFFLLFLMIVGASFVQLNSIGRIAIYGLRTSWYVSAFIAFLYLVRHRGAGAQALIVKSMVLLWALIVFGGYLSIFAPELQWSTPVAQVLPGVLADNEFIHRLINPQVSEIQIFRFEDVTLHRPAAPFAYTNAWGSTLAMVTPFVLAALHDRRIGIPRKVLVPLLALGVVPFYVALNRGSWLTLGAGVCYGVARYAFIKRNAMPIVLLVALLAIGAGFAASTGVLDTATEQLATRSADSNETRSNLYAETIREAAKSPLIGYGSTRTSPSNPSGPPLGTHGQLWAVLFAHGYLGVGLYLAFFLSAFFRSRPLDPVAHWAKVSLFIGLMQLPIYGHLPHQLFVMVGAVVISTWGSQAARSDRR